MSAGSGLTQAAGFVNVSGALDIGIVTAVGMRVNDEEEYVGLDIAQNGEQMAN